MNLFVHARSVIGETWQMLMRGIASQFADQKPGMISSLDGIRALACIMVVMYHTTTAIYERWDIAHQPFLAALNESGARGVTLFFVLSGFLLFSPYAQSLLWTKKWPLARIYYVRRILRILPAYYFALIALILLKKPWFLQPHNIKTALSYFLFSQEKNELNGVFWTLEIEFKFYLVLPIVALILLWVCKPFPPRYRALILLAILFISTFESGIFHHVRYYEDFSVGMIVAVFYQLIFASAQPSALQRLLRRFGVGFWILGLLILTIAAWRNGSTLPYWPDEARIFDFLPWWFIEGSFAYGFGLCVLGVLCNRSGFLQALFSWTPLRWFGLISFSLYLWHSHIIEPLYLNFAPYLFLHFASSLAFTIYVLLEVILIIPISFMLYTLIERPAIRLSQHICRIILSSIPGTSTLSPSAPSSNTSFHDDLPTLILPVAKPLDDNPTLILPVVKAPSPPSSFHPNPRV